MRPYDKNVCPWRVELQSLEPESNILSIELWAPNRLM